MILVEDRITVPRVKKTVLRQAVQRVLRVTVIMMLWLNMTVILVNHKLLKCKITS